MLRRIVCAFLLGAAMVAGFAPLTLFPVAIISMAGLVWLLGRAGNVRCGFVIGFSWGLGCFLFGVSWLYIALNRFGAVPMPLAALAILLFCAYLALFPAIAAALFVRLRQPGLIRTALLFASLWTFSELLRGWLFTGFPWLALGYTQTTYSPLNGFFPLLGVYGVGFVAALIAALLALAPWRQGYVEHGRPGRQCVTTLVGLISLTVLGCLTSWVSWTAPTGEPIRVALIQTNIEQDLKWAPERLKDWLEVNAGLARDQRSDLVVLPETTLPLLMEQLPDGYLEYLSAGARTQNGDLVVGIFTRDENGRIYNSALSYGTSPEQRYAKSHLVPFGEYSPPLFGWIYRIADIPMSDQTSGGWQQPPLMLGDQRIGVNICYEDLFGRELLRFLPDATLMLNLSNLAWYGQSLAQPQHLQIARARALETGRPMLRATNTGMTAVILPNGQLDGVLPAFERGVLNVAVQGYQGMTPYARWGDWVVSILAAFGLFFGLSRRRMQVA